MPKNIDVLVATYPRFVTCVVMDMVRIGHGPAPDDPLQCPDWQLWETLEVGCRLMVREGLQMFTISALLLARKQRREHGMLYLAAVRRRIARLSMDPPREPPKTGARRLAWQ